MHTMKFQVCYVYIVICVHTCLQTHVYTQMCRKAKGWQAGVFLYPFLHLHFSDRASLNSVRLSNWKPQDTPMYASLVQGLPVHTAAFPAFSHGCWEDKLELLCLCGRHITKWDIFSAPSMEFLTSRKYLTVGHSADYEILENMAVLLLKSKLIPPLEFWPQRKHTWQTLR